MTTISLGVKQILKYFYVPNNNTKGKITLLIIIQHTRLLTVHKATNILIDFCLLSDPLPLSLL